MKSLNHTAQNAKWIVNKVYRGFRLYHSNGSSRAKRLLLKHFLTRVRDGNVPEIITIGVTYRCQCSCVHCSSNVRSRKKSEELSTWEIKSIIDQSKRLGVVRVTFFGGEPLLRKDIIELVKYAHNAGMITRINTNGWLLSRELVLRLKAAGLTLCDVSIDDADPETHDRLRGLPGLYKKAVEGIKLLNEHNILCQIVTYAAKKNVTSGIEAIIALGRALGVYAVSIVFPMATGCWYNALDVLLTEEEKEKVRGLGDHSFIHVELPTRRSKCNVLKKKSLYVSPEGNITPCPFIPYAIGNTKRATLEDVWRQFNAKAHLKKLGDCPMNDIQSRQELLRAIESM